MPKRVRDPSGALATLSRSNRPWTERPFARTRVKSRLRRRRASRGKRSLSGLGVPGVVDFDTLGQQALASALTAACEDGAAALGLHPRAKAKLPLASALARLIGAFHIRKNLLRWNR